VENSDYDMNSRGYISKDIQFFGFQANVWEGKKGEDFLKACNCSSKKHYLKRIRDLAYNSLEPQLRYTPQKRLPELPSHSSVAKELSSKPLTFVTHSIPTKLTSIKARYSQQTLNSATILAPTLKT